MGCLNPVRMINPRYRKLANQKFFSDQPDYEILVPCGKCVECRKSMARDWRCRLLFEVKSSIERGENCYFATLTVNQENYDFVRFSPEKPIRLYLELYRKKVGRSLRHFFITELGEKSGRFHYHGLVFGSQLSTADLCKTWKYGFSYFGYCNYRSASYVCKYILKESKHNPSWYRPRKFVSPGLGKGFFQSSAYLSGFYTEQAAVPRFVCKIDGFTYTLPRYFRDKIFSKSYLLSLKFDQRIDYYAKGISDLKIKGLSFYNVDDYLEYRESIMRDSVARGMSTYIPSKPRDFNIVPDRIFEELPDFWDFPPFSDDEPPF